MIVKILLLDMVFWVDSILTAIGMTNVLPIMIVAVLVSIGIMLVAADPLAEFIGCNPAVVMLALAFTAGVEMLNIMARQARQPRMADTATGQSSH